MEPPTGEEAEMKATGTAKASAKAKASKSGNDAAKAGEKLKRKAYERELAGCTSSS
jgi:hypothetical protein